jgi:hypothetical protein
LIEGLEISLCITYELSGRGHQDNSDFCTGIQQVPGSHESIATVVAFAAKNEEIFIFERPEASLGDFSDSAARVFHQHQTWNAKLVDGGLIAPPHFFR